MYRIEEYCKGTFIDFIVISFQDTLAKAVEYAVLSLEIDITVKATVYNDEREIYEIKKI